MDILSRLRVEESNYAAADYSEINHGLLLGIRRAIKTIEDHNPWVSLKTVKNLVHEHLWVTDGNIVCDGFMRKNTDGTFYLFGEPIFGKSPTYTHFKIIDLPEPPKDLS